MSPSFVDEDLHNLRKPKPFKLGQFLYNTEDGTVMGRDRSSWGKFIVYCRVYCCPAKTAFAGI